MVTARFVAALSAAQARETEYNANVISGARNRIRKLAPCDRLLLVLTCGWSMIGIAGNYSRMRGLTDRELYFWSYLTIIMWAAFAGVVAYSIIRRQRRPADYGFSFQRGGLVSVAILAVIHSYLVLSGKFVLAATEGFLWSTVGAFMEEIVFRAIAIDKLILLMDGIRAKAFWAILASSILFFVPHIASKSHSQLPGLFFGALLLGCVYYKSRSILLPAWIHCVANAGYSGGIFIAALYCLIGVADWTASPRRGVLPRRQKAEC